MSERIRKEPEDVGILNGTVLPKKEAEPEQAKKEELKEIRTVQAPTPTRSEPPKILSETTVPSKTTRMREELKEIREYQAPPPEPEPEPSPERTMMREELKEIRTVQAPPAQITTPKQAEEEARKMAKESENIQTRIDEAFAEKSVLQERYEAERREAQKILSNPERYNKSEFQKFKSDWESYENQFKSSLEQYDEYISKLGEAKGETESWITRLKDFSSEVKFRGREKQLERLQWMKEASAIDVVTEASKHGPESPEILDTMKVGKKAPSLMEPVTGASGTKRAEELERKGILRGIVIGTEPGADLAPGSILESAFRYEKALAKSISEERARGPSFLDTVIKKEELAFQKAISPLRDWTIKTREKAVEMPAKGKPWEGFGLYAQATVGRFGLGFLEGITFPARPQAWYETGETLYGLVTSKEHRSLLAQTIKIDPFGFVAEVSGGFTGGYVFGKGVSYAKGKITELKTKRFLKEYPEEMFFVKEELGMQYPEEATAYRQVPFGLKEERVPIIEELGEGWLQSKLIPKGKWPKTRIGYKRTGHDLLPVVLPEGMGEIRPIYKPIFGLVPETSHLPGISISSVVGKIAKPSKIPSILGFTGVIGAIPKEKPKPITTVIERGDLLKSVTGPTVKEALKERGISKPSPITVRKPKEITKPTTSLIDLTVPTLAQRQRQRQDLISLTIPKAVQKQIQEPRQIQRQPQKMGIPPMPVIRPPKTRRVPSFMPRKREERKPRKLVFPKFGWEVRRYPVREPESFLKKFVGAKGEKEKEESFLIKAIIPKKKVKKKVKKK